MSRRLALAIGYDTEQADIIEQAARLHDIGKLATPDCILLKRGKLSAVEKQVVQRHSTEGCRMLTDLLYAAESARVRVPGKIINTFRVAAEVAQHHHEWWDGSGYPRRVSGETIPEAARIVALADVFDELTHGRPYKRPYSTTESIATMRNLAGRQFDPRLCARFFEIAAEFEDLVRNSDPELSPFEAANRVVERIVATAH
jgi:putative two-component system response regulator